MLTVVYFSIPQHKLVFLLPHGTITDSVCVGVVTRDKIDWLSSNLTDLTVIQPILLVSTVTPAH